MVGELKKGKYVYYHCTGGKARVTGATKCPDRYTRQEVLEEQFGELMKGLSFDKEIVTWVATALRESHIDEKQHHGHAIETLHAEYMRLQKRIDDMYLDKLDGRIETEFFDRKASEWGSEQARIRQDIEQHEGANQTYLEEGLRVLELARRAHELFQKQPANEKRRMLDFVLSNCSWKDGKLTATFRQPFDIIAGTVANDQAARAAGDDSNDRSEIWLPEGLPCKNRFSNLPLPTSRYPERADSPLVPPMIVLLLKRAEEFRRLLDSGAVRNQADLARMFCLTRARVTQLLQLLDLEPSIRAYAKSLASGTPTNMVTERGLRLLLKFPPAAQLRKAKRTVQGFSEYLTALPLSTDSKLLDDDLVQTRVALLGLNGQGSMERRRKSDP